MKTILFVLSILFTAETAVKAQVISQDHSIKGIIVDSAAQKAAGLVTVTLKNAAKQSVKSVITKTDGSFSFEKMAAGKYMLVIVSIGYSPKTMPVELTNSQPLADVGSILISPV